LHAARGWAAKGRKRRLDWTRRQVKARSEPTRHGAVVVLRDATGRIALQLRDDSPDVAYGGHWGLFGGWLEPGETPLCAAIREIAEELSIHLDAGDVTYRGEHVAAPPHAYEGKRIVTHVFCAVIPAEALPAKPAEGQRAAWHHPADAREAPTIPHHQAILDHEPRP
jgi:8-oxo-dGTP diphosphatase